MARKQNDNYDVIVIGSGMSGGWAAKEFCEKGYKTLVLERGPEVRHVRDYPTTNMMPWEFEHRGQMPEQVKKENPSIARCYAFREDAAHFFVKDTDHPYVQDKPFDWIRGYQTGGKSLMWARMTQRWSQYDFDGPRRDGFAVPWPINYDDMAPWYSHVEKFVGISGSKEGLDVLPDGEFLPPFEMTCVEKHFSDHVAENYNGERHVIIGRCAHITGDVERFAREQGRALCQQRSICQRGCPFGGYFSSNSSTLPYAERTGNMTLRPDSVVESIIYDDSAGKATGVRVIDAKSKEVTEYSAKVIFVNAGAINTNLILLNSTSARFPEGLGNDNGLLGKYVAFHNYRGRVSAEFDGFADKHQTGRRPTGCYMPRFRNVRKQETDFLRGYAISVGAGRQIETEQEGFGTGLKENLLNPEFGKWRIGAGFMGETIPKETNRVWLDPEKKDEWGMPLIHLDIDYDENDEKMLQDFFEQMTEMFENAGYTNIQTHDSKQAPGLDIHEMGGVRMGTDPKTSLLNKWNQLHACTNVYVTDGACMTSTSTQNPSLTYMAFTARAANHAMESGQLDG